MSLVDSTFGSLSGPLVRKWGRTVTFHKTTAVGTYNPTTGAIAPSTTNYTIKALITRVQANEATGTIQTSDYKIVVAPDDIANNTISTADFFTITRGSRNIKAKVVEVMAIEGDNPVLFVVFARPQ